MLWFHHFSHLFPFVWKNSKTMSKDILIKTNTPCYFLVNNLKKFFDAKNLKTTIFSLLIIIRSIWSSSGLPDHHQVYLTFIRFTWPSSGLLDHHQVYLIIIRSSPDHHQVYLTIIKFTWPSSGLLEHPSSGLNDYHQVSLTIITLLRWGANARNVS